MRVLIVIRMKRQFTSKKESHDFALRFFEMDEAVEILLSCVSTVRLVAQLIQVSKRMRYQVWHFLSNSEKCGTGWVDHFCQDLFRYRDRHVYDTIEMRAMDPIFIQSSNGYCLCRILNSKSALWTTFYRDPESNASSWPGWIVMTFKKPITLICDWYFVARALLINWDRRIFKYNSNCWKQENITTRDKDLCLF